MPRAFLLVFVCLLFLSSCIDQDLRGVSDTELKNCLALSAKPKQNDQAYLDYHSNFNLWQCHDIENYKFRIFNIGQAYFFESALVTVRDGVVENTVFVNSFIDIEWLEENYLVPTIETYFEIIEQAVDEQIAFDEWLADMKNDNVADRIRGNYDPIYGFPIDVYIDYHEGYADEETSLRIADFEVL